MSSSDLYNEILEETRDLVQRLAHPRRKTLALSPEVADLYQTIATEAPGAESVFPASAPSAPPVPPAPPTGPAPEALISLEQEVSACTKCELCTTRTQTVFADGNPNADLVFVGEAPGADEDRIGKPFVGKAGQLLTDIIVKGMKLRREDVYICNVLKCRPPNNRDPLPTEKELCEPYLIRQLELVKPKVICALGAHAAKTLLRTEESTGRLRGRWHFYHGIPLRVTYHPAYLLRSPDEKKKTWDDIQHVMRLLAGAEKAEPGPGSLGDPPPSN
ncbi:MAG: uracil-DNA glycosylase [Candidatus Hydrogenedentes bacterium]|nr:uracil-DNA glycosylase [Candidatus Hydrogenedentota bacterium]